MLYRESSTEFKLHSNAVENQFGVLIHELAHIYYPDHAWSSSEIYDLNAIINAYPFFGMAADHQLNNANNYAYYAVCKLAQSLNLAASADLVISYLFRLQRLAAIQQEHRQEKTRLERSFQHDRTNTKRTGGRFVHP